MKSIRFMLGGLLLLLPLTAHAADKASASVPGAQRQAFRLGFALQSPAAQTEEFLQAVKGLKTITDDVQGTNEVGKLARQSEALRATEARAYGQAAQMLHSLSAPQDLQDWADHAAKRLTTPLVLSKEAKGYLQSDPNTATVMGTIDEAQDVKTSNDQHMPNIVAWIKITQGGEAVWAAAIGQLTAGMHAAVMTDRSLSMSRTDIMRLRDTAPLGTPAPVLNTLTDLSPRAGNLAGLIRLPETQIPIKELKQPQNTLLDVYAARPLADAIDKGAK